MCEGHVEMCYNEVLGILTSDSVCYAIEWEVFVGMKFLWKGSYDYYL